MNNKYNIWNKWDKLKTVMLGDTYSAEFFRDIKNNKIRSALTQIADETQYDLMKYEETLKDFGCKVIRPELDKNDNIMNYINDDGAISTVPRAPMQVRDAQLVIGNKLFHTFFDHEAINVALNKYNAVDVIEEFRPSSNYKGIPMTDDNATTVNLIRRLYSNNAYTTEFGVEAPSITVIGTDIYIDKAYQLKNSLNIVNNVKIFENIDYIKDNFKVNKLSIGGHNDGVFGVVKEGAILSLAEIQSYDKTFPGWDICYLEGQSWDKIAPFLKVRRKNKGAFWVPGQEDNDEFTHFVQTWLNKWVGYVEETVFDVNVLVLDDKHVCVSQIDNPVVNKFLKKHNMEAVYVPWRHRYFWDGGLHCITLDLNREGKQENYFPDRTECVICEGFN